MSVTDAAGRAWDDIKGDVLAQLQTFGSSLKEEEMESAMRAAELSTEIGIAKMMGVDTTVAEAALRSIYLSLNSAAVQGAALVAVKTASTLLRRFLNAGLILLAGL